MRTIAIETGLELARVVHGVMNTDSVVSWKASWISSARCGTMGAIMKFMVVRTCPQSVETSGSKMHETYLLEDSNDRSPLHAVQRIRV
jgi:hypothetical protein